MHCPHVSLRALCKKPSICSNSKALPLVGTDTFNFHGMIDDEMLDQNDELFEDDELDEDDFDGEDFDDEDGDFSEEEDEEESF